MFSIIDKGNDLVIKNPNIGTSSPLPFEVISSPKVVLVLGANSVYDSFSTKYTNKKSITFFGKKILSSMKQKNGQVDVEIFNLENNNAYLISYDMGQYITVSRSFKLSIDYASTIGLDLIKIIKEDTQYAHDFDGTLIINNDFSDKTFTIGEDDSEKYMLLNLDFHDSDKKMIINLLVDSKEYTKDSTNMFYTEYSGTAPNIGRFSQIIVKSDIERFPDNFPIGDLNGLVVFTDLINENAQTVLCPRVMQLEDYRGLIAHAKKNGSIHFTYTGLHNNGCTIQVDMKLLADDEATPSFQARVTRLVLLPQIHPVINV